MHIRIGNFIDLSLIDVLGYPSAVIFFSGCNFNCPWCHNREILDKGYLIPVENIIKRIKNNYLIDYVQVSGGEPTLQREGLVHLFRNLKEIGLNTSLNTNGSNPQVITDLLSNELIDHIAMDIKFPLEYDFPFEKIIGIEDKKVIKNISKTLEFLSDFGSVEIRTTLVPELSDEDIFKICDYLNSVSTDFIYVLQQCITDQYITPLNRLKQISKEIKNKYSFKKVLLRAQYSCFEV